MNRSSVREKDSSAGATEAAPLLEGKERLGRDAVHEPGVSPYASAISARNSENQLLGEIFGADYDTVRMSGAAGYGQEQREGQEKRTD